MDGKFCFRWTDLRAVVVGNYRHPYKNISADDINDAIYNYVYDKHCKDCEKEKQCHDNCVYCDDMRALLERLGFEV